MKFPDIERITIDPNVMDGKPRIWGTRVTVGTVTGLVASGVSFALSGGNFFVKKWRLAWNMRSV